MILSAKHGFLPADQVIEPYEQRMSDARADEMLAELPDFDAIEWPAGVRSIFLAGGKTYRRVMRAAIERRIELGLLDRDLSIVETHGGIGYQRAQLGAYLRALTPEPYRLGNTYQTQSGELVTLVEVANEGTHYETMACAQGIHRYTRRDFGRVTGSPFDYSDPRNIPPLYPRYMGACHA